MSVDSEGEVTWSVFREPGPMSEEEKKHAEEMNRAAEDTQGWIQDVLRSATATEQEMSRSLKVIFGTTDNFDTEARKYAVDREEADVADSWTASKLGIVRAGLLAKGWDDAAALLEHWMENSGEPYEVAPKQVLNEIPTFREDVNSALQEVQSKSDGTFSTSWEGSRPPADERLNWYYGLNNFEYRVVGEEGWGDLLSRGISKGARLGHAE